MSGRPPAPPLFLRGRELRPSPARPLVMGIVNASPESFSDGTEVGGAADQIARGLAMRDAGAHIVDVGGESGATDRPHVAAADEIGRVVPVIEALAGEDVLVSVDTWKADVARAALAAGAAMVNDPSGLIDPCVAEACAESGAALVVAHTRAAPKEKAFPEYADVAADVKVFLGDRMGVARELGVHEQQLVLDPGPDLAKRPADTIAALRGLPEFAELGRPLLLAASRKDFVGALTGRAPQDRLAGTLAAIGAGLDLGASILRVHDVPATIDFLSVRAAVRGEVEVAPDLHLDPGLRRAV